ncbi:LysR family transcriptional regulator [Promicromonospora kroppenstedtii]|uniref:LysR family transcriptional regulator n=1 Tax=Promicromonospora kroppenstedtii TaxID=440482 RepID=UPI0004B2E003|nr:LysR family transcriptional regulator [Promicromonospora kroppenstedtii]
MDTRHLEYFIAVAEEGSFTRAAHRLQTVQSAVSAGVRTLEREVRATLFVRSTRRVELSDAGRALLPEARAAVESLDRVYDVVAAAESGLRGRLRLGVFANSDMLDIPALAGRFHQLYPGVALSVVASPTGSTGLVDDVRAGRLDVAITGLPAADLAGLRSHELLADEFVAVVPEAHELAGRAVLSLEELVGEPFVDGPPGFGNRVIIERELAARGLRRSVVVESPDMSLVAAFVAAGLGVAAIPRMVLRPAPGAVVLPLDVSLTFSMRSVSRLRATRPVEAALALLDGVARSPNLPAPGTPGS